MKYTLLIVFLLSLNVQAQKIISVSRILEVTSVSYNEDAKELEFDTIPIPLKNMNAKIIFTNEQLQIIDSDTVFINLGVPSEMHEDSIWMTKEWSEADLSGALYYITLYQFKDRKYNEVVVMNAEDSLGYNYKLAPLKTDVIPTASTIEVPVKKKKK
jgi:hypothetical protein